MSPTMPPPGEKIVFVRVLLCYFVLSSMVRPLYRHESTRILDKASFPGTYGLGLDGCCAGYLLFRLRQYQKPSLRNFGAILLIARSAANIEESGQNNQYTSGRAGSVSLGEALDI